VESRRSTEFLKVYYSHLLSDNPALPVSVRSAWGPLDEPVQDNQQQSFLSSLCSLADSSSAEVNEELVNELLIVKKEASQATWFKAMRGNDSLSILVRKRLIFLLIRDLLGGVSDPTKSIVRVF
jgi:hypothetical protein